MFSAINQTLMRSCRHRVYCLITNMKIVATYPRNTYAHLNEPTSERVAMRVREKEIARIRESGRKMWVSEAERQVITYAREFLNKFICTTKQTDFGRLSSLASLPGKNHCRNSWAKVESWELRASFKRCMEVVLKRYEVCVQVSVEDHLS